MINYVFRRSFDVQNVCLHLVKFENKTRSEKKTSKLIGQSLGGPKKTQNEHFYKQNQMLAKILSSSAAELKYYGKLR